MEIEFYDTADGKCPVAEFLDSLNAKMHAKVLKHIDLLECFGEELRLPYSRLLEDGIFELRTQMGSDITRILYFFVVGGKAVLTHGFVKKTQKTPVREIARAKQYRQDYLRRLKQ